MEMLSVDCRAEIYIGMKEKCIFYNAAHRRYLRYNAVPQWLEV
jgi:hypothetical protein